MNSILNRPGSFSILILLCSIFGAVGFLGAASLRISFTIEDNGMPLELDAFCHRNSAGQIYSLNRLDWLASDFSITAQDGGVFEFQKAISFISRTGGEQTFSGLSSEGIREIAFHLGPDKATNAKDPSTHPAGSPLNPNINGLHWSWQEGYIFMAIEGLWRSDDDQAPEGFVFHYARDKNRMKIVLPVDIELTEETHVVIALSPCRILEHISFADDGVSTHSSDGDPIVDKMRSALSSAFRVAEIDHGIAPVVTETIKPIDLPANPKPFPVVLPSYVPIPGLPADNPILSSRVHLGEVLFNDPRLSRTGTLSCSSCHIGHELSDPRRFSTGVDGLKGNRHAMPLFNLAWKSRFFWDGRAGSLRELALMPIQDPLEMDEKLVNVVHKLEADLNYRKLFNAAFGSGEITPLTIGLAIENFLLTRVSFNSRFDLSVAGLEKLTPEEQRGLELFFTEFEPRLGKYGADCFHCHGGAHFTDHSFHNNGIAPSDDIGLEAVTGSAADRYKFSTPSLRNIAKTSPYMHDGRFSTLDEVIDHYNDSPASTETLDPNIAKHRSGLRLSDQDKSALVAFLKTL